MNTTGRTMLNRAANRSRARLQELLAGDVPGLSHAYRLLKNQVARAKNTTLKPTAASRGTAMSAQEPAEQDLAPALDQPAVGREATDGGERALDVGRAHEVASDQTQEDEDGAAHGPRLRGRLGEGHGEEAQRSGDQGARPE